MFSFVYPFPDYRFFNIENSKDEEGTAIYKPFNKFKPEKFENFPESAQVWIMPGIYEQTQGVYNKSCVLRAPYSSIILK